jgi:signal transduction histidine kinase/ActR/RegA family two-component response regulator
VTDRNRGMRLTTRLLLLTFASLLPTLLLAGFIEYDQRAERKLQLADLVLRQAELLNGDIGSIVLGTKAVLSTLSELPLIREPHPACSARFVSFKRNLPSYVLLALIDRDGQLVCSSAPDLAFPSPSSATVSIPGWGAEAIAANGFTVGRYADPPGLDGTMLPFYLPLTAPDGTRLGTLVAGLDLGWLASHLRELTRSASQPLRSSVLAVLDRDGVILARDPQHDDFSGHRAPDALRAALATRSTGVLRLHSIDGIDRLTAHVPVSPASSGLSVTVQFYEPDLLMDIRKATVRDAWLLAAALLATTVILTLAARRFIGRPTAELVGVAERWRQGDLHARANVPESRSEFGQIAATWNEMADALERREAELMQQARTLETRVAERTRALAETNNRLQVEIAERQQTEAALTQAQKLQTVGQLAGGIAHDFNNLLATILGSLELIGRGLTPEQTKMRNVLGRASEAVQRGAQLTGRLLAFSRRKPLAVRATDINRLINDLGTLLATSTLGRRSSIDIRLEPGLWPAMAEPGQVEAAILNLALNGRDAMARGGVLTISTSNETLGVSGPPTDPKPGAYVAITVRDTGEGMTEEVARRAFEPFFTTKGAQGSGLGLSQVAALANEAGGGVRIDTAAGAGTAVTLLLPRARSAPAVAHADPKRQPSTRRWNILLVDDDDAVRQVTADMLLDLGNRVRQAADGADALAILADAGDPPDLLVVDYAMPVMNGLALAAAARAAGFTGPVLLATGYAEEAEPELGEIAPDAVLHKPFTSDALARALARLARRAKGLRTDTLQSAK